MLRCVNCYSDNISKVLNKDRIIYACKDCGTENANFFDASRKIFSTTVNGIRTHWVSAAIIEKNGKYLFLNRRNFPFGYSLPSGHIEFGEEASTTLRREVLEETGLVVTDQKLILRETIEDVCKNGAKLHKWHVFKCKTKGQIKLDLSESIDYKWVSKTELEKLPIVPQTKVILSSLKLLDRKYIQIENDPAKSTKHTIQFSMLEELPLAVIVVDNQFKLIYKNKRATKLFHNLSHTKRTFRKFIGTIKERVDLTYSSGQPINNNINFEDRTFNILTNPVEPNFITVSINDVTQKTKQEVADLISYETSLSVSSSQNFNQIIKTLLNQLFNLDILGCSLFLKEESTIKLTHRFSLVDNETRKETIKLKSGEGLAGWVIDNKKPLVISDTEKEPVFVGKPHEKERALLCVPVMKNDEALGVISISKLRNSIFTEQELKITQVVANRIGIILENKRLYNELKKEKTLMEQVLANSTNGITLLDKNDQLIFMNKTATSMLNLSEKRRYHTEDIIEQMGDNTANKLKNTYKRTKQSLKPVTINIYTNKTKFLKFYFIPLFSDKKKLKNVLIITSDYTSVKQKQELVQKQIEQITSLFKISSFQIKDLNIFFSRTIKKTSELLNSPMVSIFPVSKTISWESVIQTQVSHRVSTSITKSLNPSDGAIFNNFKKDFPNCSMPLRRLIVSPIRNESRLFGFLYAANKSNNYSQNDLKLLGIIANKMASYLESSLLIKELRNEKEQISQIIENTGDAIMVMDKDSKPRIWNNAVGYLSYLLYGNKDTDPSLLSRLIFPKESVKTELIENKIAFDEIKYRNHENEVVWLGVTYSEVRQENRESIICVARDITDEKEAENKKNEFIYTATHELRTPLTAIRGYLSMISSGDAGKLNFKQQQYIKRVSGATEKLKDLVEELLEAAKLEEKKISYDIKPFSALELVNDVAEAFSQKAKDRKLELKIKPSTDLKLLGDYSRTSQALSNLVDNAIKYTKKGTVTLAIEKNEKEFGQIKITDTGVGIPQKNQSLLFNKFYRVTNPVSIEAGGTGLGLFIVKNLINQQGGDVYVESKLKQGTVMSLSLPIAN